MNNFDYDDIWKKIIWMFFLDFAFSALLQFNDNHNNFMKFTTKVMQNNDHFFIFHLEKISE